MSDQSAKIFSIAQSIPSNSITRFAPSPTGYLHLGHILSAIYTWVIARLSHSKILLRIENHDLQRSRQIYEDAIIEDLFAFGFHSDLTGQDQIWRQTDRNNRYSQILRTLLDQGVVYACKCSRKDILSYSRTPSQELHYPGTCQDLKIPFDTPNTGLRLRLPPKRYDIHDLFHDQSVISQCPAMQCGDLLIRDRNSCWTYQFCCVIDDADQGVDLIIRGTDLLESIGRQLQVAEICGWKRPMHFFHHPLIRDEKGVKLSKSLGSMGVRDMRKRGLSVEAIIGKAAFLGGLIEQEKPYTLEELIEGFKGE